MPFPLIPFLIGAVTWLGRIGLAAFAINEIKKLTTPQKDIMAEHASAAAASGLPEEEQKKLIAATTYEQIEKAGKNPNDFWNGLSDEEKGLLKYSPDTVRSSMERTSFLGIAQTVLWVAAAAAAGFGAFRGIPIVSKGLGQLVAARNRGAGATELLTFIEQTKMGILQKVWVPGTVASIAAAGGWLTGALANNMNDAFLWGPTFLDQAAGDVEKAFKNKGQGTGGTGSGLQTAQGPRTIIRMVEEKKPQQFLGTLFSAKLGKLEHFDRKLDDEITDMADLETDVKINVNKWLQTLPGRMGYSIVIRKDPVDETGVQQSGIWATATLHILQLSGKILPIDTILLGPVTPQVRLELARSTKTIETQIEDIVSAQEIREIDIPSGIVDIFSPTGERVFQSGNTPATTSGPVALESVKTPEWVLRGYLAQPSGFKTRVGSYELEMIDGKLIDRTTGVFLDPNTLQFAQGAVPTIEPATPPTPPPATSDESGTVSALASGGTLRKGNRGEAVSELQTLLGLVKFPVTIDGIFGAQTETAVRSFQSFYALVVDGIVGPQTKEKLFRLASVASQN